MKLGFHFNADHCIGCHSCEAACSEKNNLPAHVAWRKVGMIEGGSWPDYRRVNISMACNHCDNPVCLQGCPTRAYTKYSDTGAVIQDSDTCFGCRYCTWVCPYNAPVYNPDAGSVSKCNMCVDRLAVGKKPACVDACLGFALDFGEVDWMAETHRGASRTLPGFPDTSITLPNIRFQQERPLPAEMRRVDFVGNAVGVGRPVCDKGSEGELNDSSACRSLRHPWLRSLWLFASSAVPAPETNRQSLQNHSTPLRTLFKGLRSDEDSLVVFTLLTQMGVGAVTLFIAGLWPSEGLRPVFEGLPGQAAMTLALILMALGLGLSTAHLGKPWRCYRALNNLRTSWVSREILFLGLAFGSLAAFTGSLFISGAGDAIGVGLGGATALFGWLGIAAMIKIYLIPARPFWNHPQTAAAFIASGLILGPLFLGGVLFTGQALTGGAMDRLFAAGIPAAWIVLAGFLLQGGASFLHLRDLSKGPEEGRISRNLILKDYGTPLRLRWILSGLSAFCLFAFFGMEGAPTAQLLLWWVAFLSAAAGEGIGRALFYKVVVPMTMPGAFFLKNRAFEAYARESGLARDPHVGVIMDHH